MSRVLAEGAATTDRSATIIAGMSMSADGFVAGPGDEVDRLFAWYATLSEASGALLQDVGTKLRAIVNGRRTFDIAQGGAASTRLAFRCSWSPTARRTAGTMRRSPFCADGV